MDKPRGFYITEHLNQQIDEAVRYYQEKHNLKKVDRSIVVTTLLDNVANWTEEALDLLPDVSDRTTGVNPTGTTPSNVVRDTGESE